ncbi:hypothetical protein V6N12_007023 [Hibiscus sabdariffa]|uniref:Uncharacterized protein n=1 Tax=Hibiscus sabdariffa TaxID=183260 RepID=A0ABR2F0L6_9ROSI
MIFEESAGSELKNDLNLWKVEPLGTAECRLHAVTWSPRVNLKDIMRRFQNVINEKVAHPLGLLREIKYGQPKSLHSIIQTYVHAIAIAIAGQVLSVSYLWTSPSL